MYPLWAGDVTRHRLTAKQREENSARFVCAACGGDFEKGWSDEEAAAEYAQDFGDFNDGEPPAVVCDDCYNLMRREMHG